jgi:transposase
MLSVEDELQVYLFTEATDMRRSFDRLSSMVSEKLSKSVLSGGLFVFFSRRLDKVKILYWDSDGYALWYKRLEAGTFRVEERNGYEEITGVDLKLLLQGMSLKRIQLRRNAKEGVYSEAAA